MRTAKGLIPRLTTCLLVAVLLASGGVAGAQTGPRPICTQRSPNKDWYRLDEVAVGNIFETSLWALGWDRAEFSTTFYPPPRRFPERVDFATEAAYHAAVSAHSCTYSAFSATDGDVVSAWFEHAPWYGAQEVMIFPYRDGAQLEIFGGYGGSEEYFLLNSRPKRVRLTILEPAVVVPREQDLRITSFRVAGRGEAELEDLFDFQPLPVPSYALTAGDRLTRLADRYATQHGAEPGVQNALNGDGRLLYIAFEILDYYKGDQWDDNAVAEIRELP